MYKDIPSSIIYNYKKVETAQIPIYKEIVKHIMFELHNQNTLSKDEIILYVQIRKDLHGMLSEKKQQHADLRMWCAIVRCEGEALDIKIIFCTEFLLQYTIDGNSIKVKCYWKRTS